MNLAIAVGTIYPGRNVATDGEPKMFRRIYWVTERVFANGRSQVLGVYTSIPNLIRHGLGGHRDSRLRLTLVKLDSTSEPFGVWLEPDFTGLPEYLDEFVRTEEFSADQCQALLDTLIAHPKAA